ncbi:MAG: GNAT family N-acetyltransferase [Planctomycetota bacterium]
MKESDTLIETWTAGQMSEAEFLASCVLHHAAFPKPGRTLDDVIAKKRRVWIGDGRGGGVVPGPLASDAPPVRFAVRDPAGRWLGNAAVLTRTIQTSHGPLTVLGLMDVATLPETRGRGLGVRLVRTAWSAVDDGQAAACLLKTSGARRFYEKLGARMIDNPLIDSTAEGGVDRDPFGDSDAMIYPADADWPDGEIDLCGPAF